MLCQSRAAGVGGKPPSDLLTPQAVAGLVIQELKKAGQRVGCVGFQTLGNARAVLGI